MLLYKYRDLKNFQFFVDILLNNRLYAGGYKEMNDPMEGEYFYENGQLDEQLIESIHGRKGEIKLCSLSREADIPLMWAHYADGGRGVVIGVEVDPLQHRQADIRYTKEPITVQARPIGYNTPYEILSRKDSVWKHEKEVRIFKEGGPPFISVAVKQIITGQVMQAETHEFIKQLSYKIDSRIEVITVEEFRRNRSRANSLRRH